MAVSQSLTLTESNVSILANTSKVRILWKSTQTGESWNGYTKTAKYYVSINGGAEKEYSVSYTLPQNATATIVDTTITINHKTDGSGSVKVRTWMDTGISAGVVTQTKTLTLTTIARASTIDALSCNTAYFTGTLTYKYTPKSASYYNRCNISVNLNGEYIAVKSINLGQKAASQQTATVAFSSSELSTIYNELPKTTKGKLRFTVRTYSDSGYSTQVGDAPYKEITLTIPNNTDTQPTVTMTLSPVSDFTSSSAIYVKGMSKVKASFTSGAGKYGASIASYKLTVSGKDYASPYTSDYLTTAGSVTVKGTVTDSRGYSRAYSKTITVINYATPSLDSLTCKTTYFNGAMTYKYTPANAVFYSRCVVALNISGTLTQIKDIKLGVKSAAQQTATLTLSASELSTIYNKFPNGKTGTLRFTFRTYVDSAYSEQIGSTAYREITLNIPNIDDTQPTATLTVSPESSLPSAFTSLYIKGKTKVNANLASGAGKYGATIKSYKVTIGTKSGTPPLVSAYVSSAGSLAITGTVTDSRGFSRTYTKTITVIDHSAPRLLPASGESEVIAARCNSEGTIDVNGTYLKIKAKRGYSKVVASGEQKNFCAVQYRYKAEGGSYNSWATILAKTATSDEIVTGALLNGSLSAQTTYVVQIRAIDDIGDVISTTISVPTEKVYRHKAGSINSYALGKYAEQENTFDVAEDWDAIFRGKVEVKGGYIPVEIPQYSDFNNLTTPNTYYARYTYVPDFVNCPITVQTTFALEVIAMGKDGQLLQRITRCSADATIYERQYYSQTWHEWEIVNPPMVVGEEYRTTERYMGKPVYTKLIFCDTLPNTTYKLFPHGAAVKQAIRCVGQMSDGNSLPFRFSTTNYVEIYAGPENVVIFAGNDKTNRSAYAQMWYIKD